MHSSTLLAASEAAPPLRRRHQRRPFKSVTIDLSVLPVSRDWAGLPPELISCILHVLDPVQIMLGADKVCRSWRRAAREEPELWRRIHMQGNKALLDRNLIDFDLMAIDAVQRSQGQCQVFWGEGAGVQDGILCYLTKQAPMLRSLILVSCNNVSEQGFMQAIKRMPLLEELQLSKCGMLQCEQVFEVVAKECPRLKHLINRGTYSPEQECRADGEAMAIAKMHELRSLQLILRNNLTNQGLLAILDNCLRLESLCIRYCCNISMTRKIKARIKTKKLRLTDYMDVEEREETEHGSPNSECYSCLNYFGRNNDEERYIMRYINDTEATVISTVRELRSLKLYRNDLTSKGLAAILDKCTHLDRV